MAGRKEELSPEEANDRDIRALKDAVRGDSREEDPVQEEPEVVEAEGEEPEEEEDPEAYLEEEEERPSRRDNRRNRFREIQEEAARERAQRLALEAQIAAMARPQQPPAPQISFEEFSQNVDAELKRIQKEELALQRTAARLGDTITEEDEDRFLGIKRRLEMQRAEVMGIYQQRKLMEMAPKPQVDPAQAYLKQKYADVDNDPVGVAEARRYHQEQVAKGRQPDIELFEEGFQAGRAKMRGETFVRGQPARPKPTASSRAKYTGSSSGPASGGATGASAPRQAPAPVEMPKYAFRLANERFSHIADPKERARRYYKEVWLPTQKEEREESRKRRA